MRASWPAPIMPTTGRDAWGMADPTEEGRGGSGSSSTVWGAYGTAPRRLRSRSFCTMGRVTMVEAVLVRIPQPYRDVAIQHRELIKFAFVGGTTWIIDTAVFLLLKNTVLVEKPLTAKIFAVLVATIASYVLNREWSFRTRGGRERHHEAALFFLVSGMGIAVYTAPLAVSRYVR